MMNEKTGRVLREWLAINVDSIVNAGRVTAKGESVSWETVCKYIELEKVTERVYYTTKELVALLNSCANNGCYDCDWNFKVDKDSRAYTDEFMGYLVKGWR